MKAFKLIHTLNSLISEHEDKEIKISIQAAVYSEGDNVRTDDINMVYSKKRDKIIIYG